MNAVQSLASQRANAQQRDASSPEVSAFVAASAGSGKTKLLIDRLLRLMLRGAEPSRILCLTYTKAAAAEMALRLQKILGEWVSLDDAVLSEQLKELTVRPDDDAISRARALFARVLDLPGGMRISTIHAFCQSLLRRFPLEAALAPHFRLMEDADGVAELLRAREEAITAAEPGALAIIAGLLRDEDFGKLIADLRTQTDRLKPFLDLPAPARLNRLRRALGVQGDEEAVLTTAVAGPDAALSEVVALLVENGKAKESKVAAEMADWLSLPHALRVEHWGEWVRIMLTGKGEVRAPGGFCNSSWSKGQPHLAAACVAESERVAAVEDQRKAVRVADATNALLTLAAPILEDFNRRKEAAGLMDYQDLITRTSQLLVDPGAAWVLFKLDGGLDHLLLDEVQDSAPDQWKIAGALTAEFFAGEAAHDGQRTVFAVGDRKQSIYSFQGADPTGFDEWRGRMQRSVTQSDGQFRDTVLNVSFRSTDAVLALVDKVFDDPVASRGVVAEGGEKLDHVVHRAGQAGQVELWPLTPLPAEVVVEPWAVARRNHGLTTAPQRLADGLAQWIAAQIGQTLLRSKGRLVEAGDILVLVRRRNDFARALVRRLKGLGVPVAGLDRLTLTEQPAVQDLLALCDVLLLPEDDLQLACVLTSPLGGLNDDDLMALAIGRPGSLWDALRNRAAERAGWQRAERFLAALLGRVDYVTPHALLVEALGPHGARARLLARLGPEAAEPIDELLGAALAHAAVHPPSLQGFLHWLRQSGAEVKRQAEEAGRAVRVMTVHGAKGLQAPIVILPDTTSVPPSVGGLVWTEDEVPLWSPQAALRCKVVDSLRREARNRAMEEYNRLLYVAMTRAEDWLVVCGWQPRGKGLDETWYEAVRRGMARLSPDTVSLFGIPDPWDGPVLVHMTEQRAEPAGSKARLSSVASRLPTWAGMTPDWTPAPAPAEPTRPTPLAPSRPTDAEFGPAPASDSPLRGGGSALERGSLVHKLLQHAPDLPPGQRASAITAYLEQAGADPAIGAEVMAILNHRELAPLFGPLGRAEQPLTGVVEGSVIGGLVDRLAVLPDQVLVADYKTNRDAPDTVEKVPPVYLRQMAAYRAVLRQIFPDRPVRCALVWTRTASVMALPDAMLDTERLIGGSRAPISAFHSES